MSVIFKRGSIYYTKFRTPKRFRSVESKSHIVLSLRTDSLAEAQTLAPVARAGQEEKWAQLLGEAPSERVKRMIALARGFGHEYRTAHEIAQAPLVEVLQRVEALPRKAAPTDAATAALLGGVPRDKLLVSNLFERFSELVEVDTRHKTAEQRRVWEGARRRAVANFIAGVRDMAIEEITRDHALRWRDWQAARVMAGKIKAESANKDFSNFGAMLNRVLEDHRRPNAFPFSRIRIKLGKSDEVIRKPIPEALIRGILLNDAKMAGLNSEARDVLLAMINTGARPSELIGLLPRHIHLEGELPYISIREEGRELKTGSSVRDIPLVGVSLDAMRRNPRGFPKYVGRATAWGNLTNKYLRNAGLPEPLTAYGLRHAFSDRLLRAKFSERIIADAMGHSIDRERYGEGLTLAERRDALAAIAF